MKSVEEILNEEASNFSEESNINANLRVEQSPLTNLIKEFRKTQEQKIDNSKV